MKKLMIILLVAMLLVVGGCSSAPKVSADYDTVSDAAAAYKGGTDLTGKTIKVRASMDSAAGIIYMMPDMNAKANVWVTIITDDANRNEVLGIKENDIVVVTVDSVDNHLTNSMYIFAKKYQLAK